MSNGRCPACPSVNTCVPPNGPPSNILFCGEAPGRDENKSGVPFVGKTGMELNGHYLPLAGLRREEVNITNAIRCLPVSTDGRLDSKRKRDMELLSSCSNHFLYPHIDEMRPSLIVPMGKFACAALDPNIDLDLHHGRPYSSAFGTLFPMYHPAQGIHEPKRMLMIRTDWVRLRRFIGGRLQVPKDEYPIPDYREATIEDITAIDPTLPMAADTESSRSLGPYCLTYSQIPGTGRLIRATNKEHLAEFQKKLDQWESIIIFHNWLYDKHITAGMGLYFPNHSIRDSMIRAFHLGNLPQGLKTLAFRLLGMRMQDFTDLVYPYSKVECLKYYREAYAQEWTKPEPEMVRGPDNIWKVYKAQSMTTKFKRFFTDYANNPEKNIIEAWDNWESSHAQIEEVMGAFPNLDIAHVPFMQMLYYATRDADATLRLWPILEKFKERCQAGQPQEMWEV